MELLVVVPLLFIILVYKLLEFALKVLLVVFLAALGLAICAIPFLVVFGLCELIFKL